MSICQTMNYQQIKENLLRSDYYYKDELLCLHYLITKEPCDKGKHIAQLYINEELNEQDIIDQLQHVFHEDQKLFNKEEKKYYQYLLTKKPSNL